MPNITPEGIRVPTGTDSYDLTNDLRKMMESATTIVPVANDAGRTALLSALVAAGRPASTTDPVYVHRSDTGAVERNAGASWVSFSPERASHVTHQGDLVWGSARQPGDISLQVSASNRLASAGGRATWTNPTALGFRGISSIHVTPAVDPVSPSGPRYWPIREIFSGNIACLLMTSNTTTMDSGWAQLDWLITGWGAPA